MEDVTDMHLLKEKKNRKIHNYLFLSILYCRCTYNYLYFILNKKFLSWKGETFTIKIE